MVRARFLADTNVPVKIIHSLRGLGYNTVTMQNVENTSQPENPMDDDQVLDYATQHKRTVVTLNKKHFKKLREDNVTHYGIIICRTDDEEHKRAKEIDAIAKANKSLQQQLFVVPPMTAQELRSTSF